jgi:hypothetical protein
MRTIRLGPPNLKHTGALAKHVVGGEGSVVQCHHEPPRLTWTA